MAINSDSNLNSKIPAGDMSEKWTNYKGSVPLVSPNNKRRIDIIIVGTGLAGASAEASLGGSRASRVGETGYQRVVLIIHLAGFAPR